MDEDAPTAVRALGLRVRALRNERGLTLAELADAAGLSPRMLGAVERGSANPSLVAVDKIATALGTDFAGLFRATSATPVLVVPRGDATPVWSSAAGSSAELLVNSATPRGTELWFWRLVASDRYEARPDPVGSEEFFFVLEGRLTLDISGSGAVELATGDSARLASDRQYSYVNTGVAPVEFIRIVQLR